MFIAVWRYYSLIDPYYSIGLAQEIHISAMAAVQHARTAFLLLGILIQAAFCWKPSKSEQQHPYAGLVPSMILFGDSVVDVGNNNFLRTIARANFPPYGRDWDLGATGIFCNGRLAIDFIATTLGLPFIPAYMDPQAKGDKIVKGINFASSASGFLDGTGKLLNVRSLTGQLQWYTQYQQNLQALVGQANASSILSQALFILSTGSNDFLNYYLNPILKRKHSASEYHQLILNSFVGFVQKLYTSGARRLAFTNMPPMGCLPAEITIFGRGDTSHCIKLENTDALAFNQLLIQALETLKSSLPGLKLAYLDIYSILLDAARNPSKYGFDEGNKGCCGFGRLEASIFCNQFTVGTCRNASKFVFWDSFHPTEAMNKIIADYLLEQGFSQLFD